MSNAVNFTKSRTCNSVRLMMRRLRATSPAASRLTKREHTQFRGALDVTLRASKVVTTTWLACRLRAFALPSPSLAGRKTIHKKERRLGWKRLSKFHFCRDLLLRCSAGLGTGIVLFVVDLL